MDFSVIIPVKNQEVYLPRCLDSLARLLVWPGGFEVLVIDNGSTDRTEAIARQQGARVFVCPELTIAGLRNFGAAQAQGQVLVFLDADCTVAPDWLQAASKWLDDEGVCCFGGPPEVPEDGTWVQKAWALVRVKRQTVEEVEWLESMNMFVRREIFGRVQGFDERLATCEDYDLSLRLKAHGRLVADRRIRAIHHGEAATLGQFFRKERWRGMSNLAGLLRHGLHWRELPSLLAPLIALLCLLLTILALLVLAASKGRMGREPLAAVLVGWQLPILLLALWKGRMVASLQLNLGLHVLLNLYFLARGASMLLGGGR